MPQHRLRTFSQIPMIVTAYSVALALISRDHAASHARIVFIMVKQRFDICDLVSVHGSDLPGLVGAAVERSERGVLLVDRQV